MTTMEKIGSASDVTNVNPLTAGYMTDLSKMIQGLQGATDPLNAFMGALPGLFGAAIGGTNPYTQAVQQYMGAITPGAVRGALTPYNEENAFYSSGAVDAATRAAGEIQATGAKDIIGMQTQMGQGLAGYGAGLLGQQTGLLGQLAGYGAGMAAPEWWQPTYMERNTGFGNFMEALGPIAGIASMFIPGAGALGALGGAAGFGSGLAGLFSSLGASNAPQAANEAFRYGGTFSSPYWGNPANIPTLPGFGGF